MSQSANSALAVGRTPAGGLFISDQNLPANVTPLTDESQLPISVPGIAATDSTAPPAQATTQVVTPPAVTDNSSDTALCQDITQRTSQARTNLKTTEEKRANGSLLIPDSGIDAMKSTLQQLNQLERLCKPKTLPER